ncbi:hypothetical protein LSH36_75g08022, partial [Paralvinella palmiformis]
MASYHQRSAVSQGCDVFDDTSVTSLWNDQSRDSLRNGLDTTSWFVLDCVRNPDLGAQLSKESDRFIRNVEIGDHGHLASSDFGTVGAGTKQLGKKNLASGTGEIASMAGKNETKLPGSVPVVGKPLGDQNLINGISGISAKVGQEGARPPAPLP